MFPPSANSGPLSDAFKARITSLIQEQLKPVVTELAAQQQTLLNNLALLRHNHNVNDYQMTRLESIRDLEQSINFKVSGALGFDPWQHPTIGTNLREPVPADPELIPQFTPVNQATPAERAAQSAALIKEAGTSARQIGVPLTFQDFPDHPSMNRGTKKEDPMHASIPLFGLRAPRWRAKQGLDDDAVPGTAAYDGVVAPPAGRIGLRLYTDRVRELKVPMWKLMEQGADSSSSSPRAGTSNSPGGQGGPAGMSSTPALTKAGGARTPSSSSPNAALARTKPLCRTYAMANMEDPIATSTSTSTSNSSLRRPSALSRSSTMATIGSKRSNQDREEGREEEEDQEEAEPAPKRRKRPATASGSGTSSKSTRRSTRVARAPAATTATNESVPQPRPAPRGRATKGKKKGNKRS